MKTNSLIESRVFFLEASITQHIRPVISHLTKQMMGKNKAEINE
jgi:hypothetical protein